MKQYFSILASITIIYMILIASQGLLDPVYAEEYDFVAGIHNKVTFHFRDGIETVNFPVFSTTADLVENTGTSFELEGVITDSPHLHKALDDAYIHRMSTLTAGSAYEWDYRYFDVDVNVIQNETILKSLSYHKCEISEYRISTLTDDYESYLASNSGFAIVNEIELSCSGVHINVEKTQFTPSRSGSVFVDYGTLPFKQAEDVHSFLTFEFDHGSEKIESVIFTLTSGFNESDYGTPSFQIITAVLPHPIIDSAISKSQKVDGMASPFNEDFDVKVEFETSEQSLGIYSTPGETIRALQFEDCIISGYDILTLRDKEEGYTGKRGFATAEVLDVECSGLDPINPSYDKSNNYKIYGASAHVSPSYNMGNGPTILATFNFDNGIEVVSFPEFYQGNLMARANPSFVLVGIPGKTPLLYEAVDDARKSTSKSTGVSMSDELFDVNLTLGYGNNVVRGFDYKKCHVTDYIIKTEHDGEESFYKGFALTNEFHFECQGYSSYDPLYTAMFKTLKADNESSLDRKAKERSTWSPGFTHTVG